MVGLPRRVVTGHDAGGRSVILSDGATPTSRVLPDGAVFHELWNTGGSPAPIGPDEPEPTSAHTDVPPPADGSLVRFVDFPPGRASPMHRTESVDYGIVLSGEVWLVLEEGETALAPGDVVVQRGTSHAWQNRSDQPARMAFILVSGRFTPELRARLGDDVELMGEPRMADRR